MKKTLLALFIGTIISFCPALANAQSVIINEFSNGDTGAHDWIELIVTADAQNLQGLWILSDNLGTWSGLQLSTTNTEFASLNTGDIILIYRNTSTLNDSADSRVKAVWPTDITTFGGGNRIVVAYYYTANTNLTNTSIFENPTTDPWPTITTAGGGAHIGLFARADTSGIFGIGYGINGSEGDSSALFTSYVTLSGAVGSSMSAHFTGDNSTTLPTDPANWAIVSDAQSTPGYNNGGANNSLPVELTSFSASVLDGSTVNLTWSTATEVNNYGFDVERSSGNSGWQKIGFVAGSGNSNSTKNYSFTDKPSGGTSFSYKLKQIDVDGSFQYYDPVTVSLAVSSAPQLLQNSPNPFNPSTTIKFYIPNASDVSIKIYDIMGREVTTLINQQATAGYHNVYWNGKNSRGENVASGVYLYRLTAGNFSETKKMNLLK